MATKTKRRTRTKSGGVKWTARFKFSTGNTGSASGTLGEEEGNLIGGVEKLVRDLFQDQGIQFTAIKIG